VRVLVADDDPTLAAALSRALHSLGHEAIVTGDGRSALDLVEGGGVSAVITDWEMPEIDGVELCRRIRKAQFRKYVYVILLTSRQSHDSMIEGLTAGADDYLSKPFDPNELRLRIKTAERILALEGKLLQVNDSLRRMNASLRATSRVDPLMEIGNRLAFEERIQGFHRHAEEKGDTYGVVMCDVDHFKLVNDTYGHQVGDDVLRLVASEVRAAVRSADFAFRYGGEEILLFLPYAGLAGAERAAERVRRFVEQKEFRVEGATEEHRITMSCGVAAYPRHARGGAGWNAIVEAADRALYQAKSAGRNRVHIADEPNASDPPSQTTSVDQPIPQPG